MSKPYSLDELISRLHDGQLTEEQTSDLRQQLKSSSEARQRYLELSHLDSLLLWNEGAAIPEAPQTVNETQTVPSAAEFNSAFYSEGYPSVDSKLPPQKQLRRLRWMLAATLLACCFLSGVVLFQSGGPKAIARSAEFLAEAGPVAIITRAEQVEWVEEHQNTKRIPKSISRVGKPLSPGWIKLKSGEIQLDFYGGTKVILEGPAEFGITARNRGHLRAGKLTFFSGSQPGGFILSSDVAQVFGEQSIGGVLINNEQLEVHAVEGDLKLFDLTHPVNEPEPYLVESGNAFLLKRDSAGIEEISLRAAQFVDGKSLELVEAPNTSRKIEFKDYELVTYGFQDGQYDLPTTAKLIDQGKVLQLRGNCWKMIELQLDITEDMVMEFDFRSNREGQIHGFGFDNDDRYSGESPPVIQIYGYEALPTIGQQHNSYSGSDWKTIRIPIGHYYSGMYKYLYFTADDDVTARAQSEFRNVRVFKSAK